MKQRLIALAAVALMVPGMLMAKTKNPTVMDISRTISDEAIIFPESFEISTQKLLEGWYMKNYTATDDNYRTKNDVPVSDEVMIARLQAIPAVIEMPYNPIVRKCIERYTKNGRARVAAMLGLSNYYEPIFEQALEQEGLPLELKYLPMIESALDPNAVSKHGATGLWQFMLATAKGHDMQVNSLVDERRDPYISSTCAAKMLKKLYNTYGDWSLAIAAYNCGPGNVNKAIRRAGGDPKSHNFWSIYNYLPAETRGYVPMFIAANYVMTYYRDHNISPVLATRPLVTDTIGITQRVHFEQISKVLNIPIEELRVLNPQFRADVIPGRPSAPYFLILPSQQIHAYIMSEPEILAYNADNYRRQVTADPGQATSVEVVDIEPTAAEVAEYRQEMVELEAAQTTAPNTVQETTAADGSRLIKHKVQPNESLASIANMYGVQPEQIKEWNSLSRNNIRVGMVLNIKPDSRPAVAQTTPSRPVRTAPRVNQNPTPATPQPTSTPSRQRQTAQQPAANTQQPPKAEKQRNNAPKTQQQPAQSNKKKDNKKTQPQQPAPPTTVTVRNGDSLDRIARREGVTVDELRQANNLSGENPVIHPGQSLKLPKKGKKNQPATNNKKKQQAERPAKDNKKKKQQAEQPAKDNKKKKQQAEQPAKDNKKKKQQAEQSTPAKKSKKR